MDSKTEAISRIGGIDTKKEWSVVYSELTRNLKHKIENNQLSEINKIFEMRDQLLNKLEEILQNNPSLGADDEFFMTLDVIRSIEKECLTLLQSKMNYTKSQMKNLVKLKTSKRMSNNEQAVVSRFVDVKS